MRETPAVTSVSHRNKKSDLKSKHDANLLQPNQNISTTLSQRITEPVRFVETVFMMNLSVKNIFFPALYVYKFMLRNDCSLDI